MTNKKRVCDGCKKTFNTKGMKKKNGKRYCNKCFLGKSKCLMPILNNKIPKSYLPPELKKRKIPSIKNILPPRMKGEKKQKIVSNKLHLFITKGEKNILYKKFISMGMSSDDSSKRVEFVSKKMSELAEKIRTEAKIKKLTEGQMHRKFLEGLARYSEEEMR